MTMNSDDVLKLETVKDYTPAELMTIIVFLEGGMFCDCFGQPYTREHIKKIAEGGTMKVWIEDERFRCIANETIAEYIVRAYLYHEMGKDVSQETGLGTVVVWQSYILGNRKYLISTTDVGDKIYFEVTYSLRHDEWYLDIYKKKQNFRVRYDACDKLIVKEQNDYDL